MPESPDTQTHLVLLSICLSLLFVVILMLFRVFSRLSRIEAKFSTRQASTAPVESAPSIAETSPGGAFESFLEEDSERRNLPKKEQFAAYRKWRQERGLNWSAG